MISANAVVEKSPPAIGTSAPPDAAIAAGVKNGIEAAVAAATKAQKDIRDAERAVRPWVGERKLALDSAEAVYRDALKALGDPEAATIHVSALRTVISRTPKPGETSHLAFDAAPPAGVKSAAERFPNAARVGVMG